jgi:hypothetical protein
LTHLFTHLRLRILAEVGWDKDLYTVLSIPTYFNDHQRQIFLDAAKAAKLYPCRLKNEAVSAAEGYGIEPSDSSKDIVFAVVDTREENPWISILSLEEGIYETSYDASLEELTWAEAELRVAYDSNGKLQGDLELKHTVSTPLEDEESYRWKTYDPKAEILRQRILYHFDKANVRSEVVEHVRISLCNRKGRLMISGHFHRRVASSTGYLRESVSFCCCFANVHVLFGGLHCHRRCKTFLGGVSVNFKTMCYDWHPVCPL